VYRPHTSFEKTHVGYEELGEIVKYLPPFETIRQSVNTSTVSGELRVDMPYEAFINVLRMMISALELDEAWYLSTYEDIAAAVRSGEILSAKHHFVHDGYFEGRQPFPIPVDERWYLKHNPDVADGVRLGHIPSAQQHFDKNGYQEGRLPFGT
jgi:hypothetical protein